MIDKTIKELHEELIKGNITSDELVKESLEKSHEVQEKCNAFVTIMDDAKGSEVTDDLLSGIPFGIKDNYSTKGILSTGSSNTLKDYVPFFTATAIENLVSHGCIPVNKTAMDEFGMGGTGTTGHTGIQRNPWDTTRMCAGSSSGSAAAVASGVYPFATGSDTGDSIRKPAAFCGIVGYKPTYGMISRYGLFPFASSLDTCGVLTRSVEDAAIVVDAMKGKDEKDMTSWDSSDIHLYDNLKNDLSGKKLFYIKEFLDKNRYSSMDDEMSKHFDNFMEKVELLRKLGATVDEVSIDENLLNAIPSIYQVISCAEATSNMSNLTGFSFGPRGEGNNYIEQMTDHRTKGFSSLIKRRFIIGSYVLQAVNQDRYFKNAQRARRLLVDKFLDLFESYDALVMPVSSGVAKKFDQEKDIISEDDRSALEDHLQIGNFGGFPSITIPDGFINGLPVGINFTANRYEDQKVLNIAYSLESNMEYKNQIAKEVK